MTLIYLPHLDYGLQKFGPDYPKINRSLREIDEVVGDLISYFDDQGVSTIILSEYGIESVDDAVHINRVLRKESALQVREEQGLEVLDAGASDAFAVADHQVAHVYVKDESKVAHYAELARSIPGVEQVLGREKQVAAGLDHQRSGELVLIAEPHRWFSYYYWLEDECAPDFARTVDIHRKPGYDPLDLFLDPATGLPKLRIAWKLLKRKLGFRTLMDVIPLDASRVRGSHGRVDQPRKLQPVLITTECNNEESDELP